jgi:hypothetical protein
MSSVMNAPGNYAGSHLSGVPFVKSLYSTHHARRFAWLKERIASLPARSISVIEIGCHDARSLDYLPVHVHRYVGLDAGWQSGWKDGIPFGLEAARFKVRHHDNHEIRSCTSPEDIENVEGEFDVAIALETFEYLVPSSLQSYIAALARKVCRNGFILSTMPNEKGIPLLFKTIGSKISRVPRSKYSVSQFCNALLGRMNRVPRAPRGRKGFDYDQIVRLLRQYFPSLRVEPVGGFRNLPVSLSLNVGIVGSKTPRLDLATSGAASTGTSR